MGGRRLWVRAARAIVLTVAGGLTLPTVVAAQTRAAREWCAERWDGDRFCEVREVRVPVSRGVLSVDGGQNGGVSVRAWNEADVLVRARVSSDARSEERAREIADAIRILTDGGRIRADGPDTGRREHWGVSFEVFVPRRTDLSLKTWNGGISIEGVEGDVSFEAQNGGVSLAGLAGRIRGRTQNGGLNVALEGEQWQGEGLDVETQNGGVSVTVPNGYSAELETGTVNGGMELGFPVTVQGRLGKRIRTTLGQGGPLVRVMTTNGGVRIKRG